MSKSRVAPVKNLVYGDYEWILSEVGAALGNDYDRKNWDHNTTFAIDSIVQSGYQRFCTPTPYTQTKTIQEGDKTETQKVEIHKAPHHWSFLNPMHSVTIKSGVDRYDFPSNFAQLTGDLISAKARIPRVSEEQLRSIIERDPKLGTPEYYAVRPKKDGGFEFVLWPNPNEEIIFTFRYLIVPERLSETNGTPVGGRQHADTILHSCLLVAAERGHGEVSAVEANERYNARLRASIEIDRQAKTSEDDIWVDDKKNTVENLIGNYLGYGPNPFSWTSSQNNMIKEVIRNAKRKFYNPAILPGERVSHEWNFLKIVKSMDIKSGVSEYNLPDNFASFESPISFDETSAYAWSSIQIVDEFELRRRLQNDTGTNRPQFAATRAKTVEGETAYELLVFPIPDQDYSVKYQYIVNSNAEDFVLGGDEHFQTFLFACYVCADELNGNARSSFESKYMERLAVSISRDREKTPLNYGVVRDTSDNYHYWLNGNWHVWDANLVTYDGHDISLS